MKSPKKTGRSIGSVNSVIADFKEGRGSEPGASDYITEMMIVAKFVKENNLSLTDFEERMESAQVAKKSGFDKPDLLSLVTAMEGVDPAGIKEYVATVRRLRKIEEESNIAIDKVHDNVVEEREELVSVRDEISQENDELKKVRGELASARNTYE
ncbi:MAG: hypothetical protein M1290_01825 [Candidatus Thermoplasmatota archaeon]|jgi:predicted  nucleic acid-binding Zn-ribbon protein|nr:hypothetical protein [Candidatus Thermoplasmatota archaeon]